MEIILKGFIVSFGLIVSIGAQNAFLLKQGIIRQHVFWIALICFVGDVLLMGLGVLGLGSILAELPVFSLVIALLGSVFLLTYGSRSFITAFKSADVLAMNGPQSASFKKVLWIAFAITFLNPQVYIDTVMILGGIGGQLDFRGKIEFLIGALSCSLLWFFGLGYGAQFLSPYFKKTSHLADFRYTYRANHVCHRCKFIVLRISSCETDFGFLIDNFLSYDYRNN